MGRKPRDLEVISLPILRRSSCPLLFLLFCRGCCSGQQRLINDLETLLTRPALAKKLLCLSAFELLDADRLTCLVCFVQWSPGLSLTLLLCPSPPPALGPRNDLLPTLLPSTRRPARLPPQLFAADPPRHKQKSPAAPASKRQTAMVFRQRAGHTAASGCHKALYNAPTAGCLLLGVVTVAVAACGPATHVLAARV